MLNSGLFKGIPKRAPKGLRHLLVIAWVILEQRNLFTFSKVNVLYPYRERALLNLYLIEHSKIHIRPSYIRSFRLDSIILKTDFPFSIFSFH